jgi:hypothetical protein
MVSFVNGGFDQTIDHAVHSNRRAKPFCRKLFEKRPGTQDRCWKARST